MAKVRNASDLRGIGRLTIDAIAGITDLVEDLHHTIASGASLLGTSEQHRKTGIPGAVYRNIRAVSGLVGSGLDAVLDRLASRLGEKDSAPGREAVLAVLNGILGDHLAASKNPLTIPMQMRRNGESLVRDDPAFSEEILASGGKLCVLVHGSSMNDLQWNRRGHDHGAALGRDLGYLPVYLHYNTGLHISENGRAFSELMETFLNQRPQPIELVLLTHSMGGLVSRSACHFAKQAGHTWLNHLRKLLFLGTPHHGAPLERGGHWIDLLLESSPFSAPFSRLGKIRSAGVTDLRFGNLLDVDWKERDGVGRFEDRRAVVPLPDGVQCYAIAATVARGSSSVGDHFIGDGLVPLNSALGRHETEELTLFFPETHQWVGREMNHLDLLSHPEVYETIKRWVQD